MQPLTLAVLDWLLSRQINQHSQAFLDPALVSLLQKTDDLVALYVDRSGQEFVPV